MRYRSLKQWMSIPEEQALASPPNSPYGSADAMELNTHEVLETIDKQLEKFGLEVVQYETGADEYFWCIEPKES